MGAPVTVSDTSHGGTAYGGVSSARQYSHLGDTGARWDKGDKDSGWIRNFWQNYGK